MGDDVLSSDGYTLRSLQSLLHSAAVKLSEGTFSEGVQRVIVQVEVHHCSEKAEKRE